MSARAAALLALALGGCASGSQVVLLPGEAGAPVGAVAVLDPETGEDRALIDQANTRAGVRAGGASQRVVKADKLDDRYGALIADLPPPARSFTLYFVEGGTRLAAGSEDQLTALFAEVAARSGAEVQIVGHTDTLGSADDNDRLSLARARDIRDALVERGLESTLTRATGRGERDLLVDTADGVREARNRRVELIVR